MKIYDELKWRGLIKDVSSPDIEKKLNEESLTFYIGTDPTGDSLHIGHFSSFLIAKRLKDAGHNPILLIGGATGLIGDPKPDSERPMISYDEVNKNVIALSKQATKLFGFEVVNNYCWTKDYTYLEFLRDIGKYFNVGYMLSKDIVKRRLDEGITYAEFSYMTLQAFDFMHLNQHKNVTLQVAGQDQWGNVTAGIELIRKKHKKEVYGLTMPLLTKKDGTKFGKSNGQAIWLDINKTSAYEMYQFFLNCEDEKVIDYLKFLTFLSKDEIDELEVSNNTEPHLRKAHKALAKAVIEYVHGIEYYESAVKIANVFFNEDFKSLSYSELYEATKDFNKVQVENELKLEDALILLGACKSKTEARKLIEANSISVNGQKLNQNDFIISKQNSLNNKLTIIRKGKKSYFGLEFK